SSCDAPQKGSADTPLLPCIPPCHMRDLAPFAAPAQEHLRHNWVAVPIREWVAVRILVKFISDWWPPDTPAFVLALPGLCNASTIEWRVPSREDASGYWRIATDGDTARCRAIPVSLCLLLSICAHYVGNKVSKRVIAGTLCPTDRIKAPM